MRCIHWWPSQRTNNVGLLSYFIRYSEQTLYWHNGIYCQENSQLMLIWCVMMFISLYSCEIKLWKVPYIQMYAGPNTGNIYLHFFWHRRYTISKHNAECKITCDVLVSLDIIDNMFSVIRYIFLHGRRALTIYRDTSVAPFTNMV